MHSGSGAASTRRCGRDEMRTGRYWPVMPGLLRGGELFASGAGQLGCAGRFLAACRFFDDEFHSMARRRRAQEHSYPALMPAATLRKLEFFSSFPQFATFASHSASKNPEHVLSPAICYHTCNFLRNRRLPRTPYCITAAGNCFRFEGRALTKTPERLWNFTMREVVFFGTAAQVERVRRSLMGSVQRVAASAGLVATLEEASDPFFLGSARGKLLLQRLKKLKYELRANFKRDGRLAIASFNNHQDFFAKRMNIRLPDGAMAHSGCVAFGIERWAYVFFCQNGLDPKRWPERLKRRVLQNEAR